MKNKVLSRVVCLKYRVFAVVSVFLLILSFVCCNKSKTEFILSEFEAVVSFKSNGVDFNGDLSYISEDDIRLVMTSPENIKGIEVIFNGNNTEIGCDGMMVSVDKLKVGTDVYTPLFLALKSLAIADTEINMEGTDIVTLGENVDIRIEISCNDMKIIKVENKGKLYNFNYI